ncbi:MAG: hypothetical protein NWS47_00440 [Alphaproteobacteria bacterium]|nr:hypothetical protein [Alphaproteobacteria bacterium]
MPSPSTEILLTLLILAFVASAPSPLNPADPVPATVDIAYDPSAFRVSFRIAWFP